MLQEKRFEEVIVETEVYFESKDESFYKKGIGKLDKRWNECTAGKEQGFQGLRLLRYTIEAF